MQHLSYYIHFICMVICILKTPAYSHIRFFIRCRNKYCMAAICFVKNCEPQGEVNHKKIISAPTMPCKDKCFSFVCKA